KAGAGNMNYTLRVRTPARSFILKQARPWVEKYPQIAAPWERALIEGRFYEVVSTEPQLAAMMPKLLGLDTQSHIIALEDLGEAQDFTTLYHGAELDGDSLDELAVYLTRLHREFMGAEFKCDFANRAMRSLNHLHIFDLPLLEDNGLDLDAFTPGLHKAAQTLKRNERYVSAVRKMGDLYLSDGEALLHGDFFPGSWLKTASGVRVIDPEFCFYGPPEFDLGVTVAHLYLAGQKAGLIERVLESYLPPLPLTPALVWQFAGVEIMRRLIGVAQLPLNSELERKAELLRLSREMVLNS
ncbi:MAG: phosphotransferase, partial [Blastocatellia bacterium]|nr:phosphotransferase [Blastocatellia bacterium]